MPTCWNCLKEVTIEHFLGGEAPTCQEADLGEPGPEVPTSEDQPYSSRAHHQHQQHPPLRSLLPENNLPNRTVSSSSRSPAIDIIRRGTVRRIQSIDRARKESAISDRRSITRNRTPLSAPTSQRPLRKFWSARNRWQRFLSLPPIPEEEEEKEEKKEEEEEAEASGEVTPTQRSSRRRPIPPLTPWRRLCLIQDYSDRDEDLRTTINRLDDAIASSPELWTPGTSERIDGQPAPPHQFYRRLHDMNGSMSSSIMAPLPIGHQQDLNFLYRQMQELGEILKSNREKVNGITQAAEEVMNRTSANGSEQATREMNGDGGASQIRKLEMQLLKANRAIELLKSEQSNNTELIGKYEDALGTSTEQIRNYCTENNMNYLAQRRHYNNLLQAEKDEHLQSRLDRDYWHAQTLKVCEMLRTAYRLRTDEWGEELKIVSGLQNEVRVLRKALGMDVEKAEDETGWPYLKDAPLHLDSIDES
ncbi:hypothetical protein EPUS_05880 [Endocarpon pusillum Z07020]|uniref:Uncharacterized protein n=1 Tax=Endocarpon pusillum (strain Z07020 / HMAS-L-300199) TaxID=1263415 RepID=U1GNJ7_ENDPU|nr:uncharacterized protein EPUS_05880 [Endocarpon pusillum Z07020]ERF73868.1 hypothetical protein EPUS_05880 [Endocarpon pusillum Z07020]